MSNKSWRSRGLRLRIDDSVCARALSFLLDTLLGAVAVSLGVGGNVAPGLLVAAVVIVRQCREPSTGRVLAWQAGEWHLECGGRQRHLQLRRVSMGLSWVVHAQFHRLPGGEPVDLWLFRDSCSLEGWRRLRVLLLTSASHSAG